jgi:hypothetical protein
LFFRIKDFSLIPTTSSDLLAAYLKGIAHLHGYHTTTTVTCQASALNWSLSVLLILLMLEMLRGMPLWLLASQGLALTQLKHIWDHLYFLVRTSSSLLILQDGYCTNSTEVLLPQRLIERIWDDSHFPYSGGFGLKVLHLAGY